MWDILTGAITLSVVGYAVTVGVIRLIGAIMQFKQHWLDQDHDLQAQSKYDPSYYDAIRILQTTPHYVAMAEDHVMIHEHYTIDPAPVHRWRSWYKFYMFLMIVIVLVSMFLWALIGSSGHMQCRETPAGQQCVLSQEDKR